MLKLYYNKTAIIMAVCQPKVFKLEINSINQIPGSENSQKTDIEF